MRIVGGEWRGRQIEAPDGRDVTRPTTDRVREAMSSMLLSACGLSFEGLSVLDAFAGSGALGLEMLSHGAAHCTFCDIDRGACERVKRNASSLGAASSTYTIQRLDIQKQSETHLTGAPFDIVLLDPPYKMPAQEVEQLVEALDKAANLAAHSLVVYERSNSAPTIEPSGFSQRKSKRYGQTAVELFRKD